MSGKSVWGVLQFLAVEPDYSTFRVVGVFTSKKKAEQLAGSIEASKSLNPSDGPHCDIERWRLNTEYFGGQHGKVD